MAAVKSCKHYLRRVLPNANLTFEEFATLLCEIESILNSRPLTPMSDDPSDLSVLTPSHFLVGNQGRTIPERILTDIPNNRLSRWQLVQTIRQHFWNRWYKDYIHQLQQRSHHRQPRGIALEVGQLVLLKEDNLPSYKWRLGRILHVHPGATMVDTIDK